mgnify:CR=1 FL=1
MNRRHDDPARLLPWLRDNNAFIAALGENAIGVLFHGARLKRYPEGTIIARQGKPMTHCYVVTEGCAATRVESRGVIREVEAYPAGEFAGLMALFSQGDAPYDVVAARETEVVAIDTRHIAELRAAFHPRAMRLLRAFWPLLTAHLQTLDRRCGEIAERKQGTAMARGNSLRG